MDYNHFDFDKIRYSQREIEFIYCNLERLGFVTGPLQDIENLKLISSNESNRGMTDYTFFRTDLCLVKDELISWLKDDLRASLWFYSLLIIGQNWNLSIEIVHNVFSRDLILNFDCYQYGREKERSTFGFFQRWDKIRIMKFAIPSYNSHKVSPKDLVWLNYKNHKQIDWAIQYLQENHLLINVPTFLPISNKERYAQICASLDALDLHLDLEQKLISKTKNTIELDQSLSKRLKLKQTEEIVKNEAMDKDGKKSKANNYRKFTKSGLPRVEAYGKLVQSAYEASDAKVEWISRMRTAWNQKVFRDKKPVKAEKKIKLPHGYEKKVKEISEAYGEDITSCLKRIIDAEYESIKSDS